MDVIADVLLQVLKASLVSGSYRHFSGDDLFRFQIATKYISHYVRLCKRTLQSQLCHANALLCARQSVCCMHLKEAFNWPIEPEHGTIECR